MSKSEGPNPLIPKQGVVPLPSGIENIDLIPMRVDDQRDPQYRSFDLDKFVGVIGRLRSEDLFKLSREFKDSDYGKYMSVFASTESNNWNEAIQSAKAIEITASNLPSRGFSHREGRTQIEVKILMNEKDGRIFNFYFDSNGKYSQGNWDDVHLEKRIANPEQEKNSFTLSTVEEVKKLE